MNKIIKIYKSKFQVPRIKLFFLSVMLVSFMLSCNRNKNDNVNEVVQTSTKATTNTAREANILTELRKIEITHYAKIKTSLGTILIALYGKDAPKTVENFTGLVKRKFYNGLLFHRVLHDFLIQTGCPNTKFKKKKYLWGQGGESIYGQGFETELNPNSIVYKIGYASGTIAMANNGYKKNLSQFFICLNDAQSLKRDWTIFGRVISGMEVVEKINSVEIEPSVYDDNDGIPLKPIKIYSITVEKIK